MKMSPLQDALAELYVAHASAFTKDEIQKIITQGLDLSMDDAIVNNSVTEVKPTSRTCKTGWFYPNPDTIWIFDRIKQIINDINDRYFNFDINQFEPLQFTSYDMDCTMGRLHKTASRKLSITIQLTDGIDYQGGDLLLYPGSQAIKAPKGLGQLVCFPSFVVHEVTPVTQGTRYSLVTWVHGPLFK